MLFDTSSAALAICGIALLAIVGNRFELWHSWRPCIAGAFVFTILLYLAIPMSDLAGGFLMGCMIGLLKWLGGDDPLARMAILLRMAKAEDFAKSNEPESEPEPEYGGWVAHE